MGFSPARVVDFGQVSVTMAIKIPIGLRTQNVQPCFMTEHIFRGFRHFVRVCKVNVQPDDVALFGKA